MAEVAIVTGASSGIGKAIYEYLKDYYTLPVIGVSRRGPDVSVDLSIQSRDTMNRILQAKENNRVGLLVNCAGIMDFNEAEPRTALKVFDVNFWTPYFLTMALIDELKATEGCVINIASISGMVAEPELPIYAASKAALISLTKSLAVAHAPEIRFNCISPGFFNTNLVDGPAPAEMINQVPMGVEAEPSEICPLVDMILNTHYMTGANLVIDGGLSCKTS